MVYREVLRRVQTHTKRAHTQRNAGIEIYILLREGGGELLRDTHTTDGDGPRYSVLAELTVLVSRRPWS